jgi:methylphosphotriester-DNA--protein-cysteine methyltransferase
MPSNVMNWVTRELEELASGASLTDAAHDAGLADSAHFSRRMFGTTAAALDAKR